MSKPICTFYADNKAVKSAKCRQENLIQKSVFAWNSRRSCDLCLRLNVIQFLIHIDSKFFWVEKPSKFYFYEPASHSSSDFGLRRVAGTRARKGRPKYEIEGQQTLAKYRWCHKPKKVYQIEMFCSLHTARVLRWIKIAELKLGERYMASMEAFMC